MLRRNKSDCAIAFNTRTTTAQRPELAVQATSQNGRQFDWRKFVADVLFAAQTELHGTVAHDARRDVRYILGQ